MPTVSITVNFQGTAEGFSLTGFGMFYLSPSNNTGAIVYTEGQTYTAEINTGGKLFSVVAVRGCTISNIQNTTFNVVFTSDTATIRVYADNPSSIIGAYTLNQTLNKLGDDGQQYDISVSFTSDDEARGGFSFVNNPAEWYIRYTGGPQPPVAYNGNTGWVSQSYRLVDFGDTAQEVPAMFKSWIEANGSAIFTITKEATNASITAPSTAKKGSNVQFTVTPNAGYTVTSVLVVPLSGASNVPTIDLGNGKYTFTMPGSDVEIRATATFASTNCTVTFDRGVTKVDCLANSNWTWTVSGSTVNISETDGLSKYKFQVTTDKKYTLSNVTGTGCTISDIDTSGGSFYVVFTDYTSSITVTSEQTTFDITKEATNASITAPLTAEKGSSVQFTVTPNAGYTVTSVLVVRASGGSNVPTLSLGDGRYMFYMPGENVTIQAASILSSTNCTVVFDDGVLNVSIETTGVEGTWNVSGTTVNVSITTSGVYLFDVFLRSGYTLSNVTGAGCTISNINRTNGTFNVVFTEAESTISVTTERRVYRITRAPVNASISAPGTAPAGANVSFTVTANTGYGTDSVLVRQSSGAAVVVTSLGNGRYSFTMPESDVDIIATATLASTNCTVTFDKGVMSVTTTAGSGGGTWHFSGTTGYISGISTSGRYTFNVTLADGYTLSNVTGTGCTILSKAATSFVVGFSSTTSRISVVTEKEGVENYPIDWKYSNATLTGAVSSAEAGNPVSFSVLPANGYEVTGVTARANEAPLQVNVSGSTYYFIMPSAAVTVTVLTELAPKNTDLRVNFDSGVGYVSANINGGSYAFSDTGDSKEISYIPGAENAFTAALVNGYRISYVNGENCTISDINYAEGTFSVVFTGTPSTVNIGTQALEPETVEVSLAVMFDAGVSAVSTNVDGTTVSWTTSGSRQTFETQDGATRDFSISLVSGYYLDSVSGTGCTITAQTENGFSVLFTSTTPNISIVTQRAAQISYPIAYSYTSGTLNGPSSAEEGETVTFTFTPENGYTVGNVTVMGNTEIEVENSGNSYSFTMPAEPVAVSITVNTPDIITIQTLGVFKEEADKAYAPFNVVYAPATLTDEQQAQARENIGAVSEAELAQALEPYALQNGTYPGLSAGHASTADRATGDENGNRIISFYGHGLTLSINPQTYVMTITLVSEDGTVLATRSIDLPLESMVVSGTYDEATKEVVLTLQSGQQVRFSVADLVDGLASQAALDTETQAREAADAALAKDISDLQDGTTPAGVASKLATEDVGSAAKPVYFENGVPVACGDSLSADITGTAAKAVSDKDGNDIPDTYATKEAIAQTNENVSALQEELEAAEKSLRTANDEIQNLYTIASQTIYLSQNITQEYTSRQTADGADIIDGAIAELKEIKGRTVATADGLKNAFFSSLASTGKNIYDISVDSTGKHTNACNYTVSNGSMTLIPTGTGNDVYCGVASIYEIAINNSFPVKENTTYTFNCNYNIPENALLKCLIGFLNTETETETAQVIGESLPRTITTPPGTNRATLRFGAIFSETPTPSDILIFSDIILNAGESAFPYQPYTTDTVSVLTPIELAEYDIAYPAENKVVRQSATITQDTPFTEDQLAQYSEYVLSQDGMTLVYKTDTPTEETVAFNKYRYKAYNGGMEVISQGETDNSEYGAELTLTQNYAEKRGGTE